MSEPSHHDEASAAPSDGATVTARVVIPWARPILSDAVSATVPWVSPSATVADQPAAGGFWTTSATAEDPLLLMRLSKWAVVLDVVVIMGLWLIVETVMAGAAFITSKGPIDLDEGLKALKDWLAPMAVGRVVVIGGAIALLTRWRGLSGASVGITRRRVWICIPIGVGLGALILMLLVPLALGLSLVPEFREGLEENPKQIMEWMPQLGITGFLGLAVAVGAFEELLFRGFLLPRLRRLTGSWTAAAALSGGLFTVLHLGEQQAVALIPIALLAVAFSVATIKTRSLVPAIVAHAVFDFVQFILISVVAGSGVGAGGTT